MQNVFLFQKNTTKDVVKHIVAIVATNKALYHIHDTDLPFDALTLEDDGIRLETFDKDGIILEGAPRAFDADGIFHTVLPAQEGLPNRFAIESQPFELNELHMSELEEIAKAALCKELAMFIVANHPCHVKDWGLDLDEPCSEKNLTHFSAYLDSIDLLYMIRAQNGKVAATLGLNTAPDKGLTYLSMVVTCESLRRKHLASLLVYHVANTYPNTVMTQYIVAPVLRQILGVDAITNVGKNTISIISGELLIKLQTLIRLIQPILSTASNSSTLWLPISAADSSIIPTEDGAALPNPDTISAPASSYT